MLFPARVFPNLHSETGYFPMIFQNFPNWRVHHVWSSAFLGELREPLRGRRCLRLPCGEDRTARADRTLGCCHATGTGGGQQYVGQPDWKRSWRSSHVHPRPVHLSKPLFHWEELQVSTVHRCPFPIGWLIGGLFTPLTTGLFDDRWYTSSRPLYFYQKDIIADSYDSLF